MQPDPWPTEGPSILVILLFLAGVAVFLLWCLLVVGVIGALMNPEDSILLNLWRGVRECLA